MELSNKEKEYLKFVIEGDLEVLTNEAQAGGLGRKENRQRTIALSILEKLEDVT